jgi:hypothetical protein
LYSWRRNYLGLATSKFMRSVSWLLCENIFPIFIKKKQTLYICLLVHLFNFLFSLSFSLFLSLFLSSSLMSSLSLFIYFNPSFLGPIRPCFPLFHLCLQIFAKTIKKIHETELSIKTLGCRTENP